MTTGQNFADYFRALRILFFALLAGQILVAIVVYFTQETPPENSSFAQESWLQGAAGFAILMMGLSMFLRKKKVESARNQATIKQKLAEYRLANVQGWALVEGPSLVCTILFMLSGNPEFLYLTAALVCFFATQGPSRDKLVRELDLNGAEQAMLDDPNAEVADLPKA